MLSPFHFLLIPKEHLISFESIEGEKYQEIREIMKNLVSMARDLKMSVIFYENVRNIEDCKHSFMEAILINESLIEDARAMFYHELTISDSKWSEHKQIIDTTTKRGNISALIPPGFSYFNVDFNAKGGYAHIIQNSFKFDAHFGRVNLCRKLYLIF